MSICVCMKPLGALQNPYVWGRCSVPCMVAFVKHNPVSAGKKTEMCNCVYVCVYERGFQLGIVPRISCIPGDVKVM